MRCHLCNNLSLILVTFAEVISILTQAETMADDGWGEGDGWEDETPAAETSKPSGGGGGGGK